MQQSQRYDDEVFLVGIQDAFVQSYFEMIELYDKVYESYSSSFVVNFDFATRNFMSGTDMIVVSVICNN